MDLISSTLQDLEQTGHGVHALRSTRSTRCLSWNRSLVCHGVIHQVRDPVSDLDLVRHGFEYGEGWNKPIQSTASSSFSPWKSPTVKVFSCIFHFQTEPYGEVRCPYYYSVTPKSKVIPQSGEFSEISSTPKKIQTPHPRRPSDCRIP